MAEEHMGKKQIRETSSKMDLVAMVARTWPEIGRNTILGFTMESMRQALLEKNPAALEAPDRGSELLCVVRGCDNVRGRGLAVCLEHHKAYARATRGGGK